MLALLNALIISCITRERLSVSNTMKTTVTAVSRTCLSVQFPMALRLLMSA